nr:MAG TPA: ASCH domain protein [Bacteriophage sp.]
MSVKPILFNTEMVRAILDGRKTCTRRLVKFLSGKNPKWTGYIKDGSMLYNGKNEPCIRTQPYQPGDILYIRETWERFECRNCDGDERGNCPKEPKKSVLDKTCGCYMYRATDEISGDAKWHPSIHMPKEAARIWLEVTNVRVERLRDITGLSVQKEGIEVEPNECAGKFDFVSELFLLFQRLWDSTVKKSDLDRYGWNANPWVWVIEFERCDKPKSEG